MKKLAGIALLGGAVWAMSKKSRATDSRLPTPDSAKNPLPYNAMMRDYLQEMGHFIIKMKPYDFLKMTTESRWHLNQILGEAQPREVYERAIVNDRMAVPPYLILSESGKIDEHDGRHRAASLFKDNDDEMFVMIRIHDPSGNSIYMPSLIISQFSTNFLTEKDFEVVWRRG